MIADSIIVEIGEPQLNLIRANASHLLLGNGNAVTVQRFQQAFLDSDGDTRKLARKITGGTLRAS